MRNLFYVNSAGYHSENTLLQFKKRIVSLSQVWILMSRKCEVEQNLLGPCYIGGASRMAHGARCTFWRHRARKKEWNTIIHYLFHLTLLHRSRIAHGASRTELAHAPEEWLTSFPRTRAPDKGEYLCRILTCAMRECWPLLHQWLIAHGTRRHARHPTDVTGA